MADDPEMDFALVFGFGSATALANLAAMLAGKGVLSASEIEVMRHHALHGFDLFRERKDLLPGTIARLEQARSGVEALWQAAAFAAERAA